MCYRYGMEPSEHVDHPGGNGAYHPPPSAAPSDPPAADEAVGEGDETALTYTCPHCSTTFHLPAEPADRVLECPACRAQFFAPADEHWLDYEGTRRDDADREDELSGGHIKQVAALRRNLYRTRSWSIVGSIALIVGAAQLVGMTFGYTMYLGWGVRPVGYVVAAVGCLLASRVLLRRVSEINGELKEMALDEPATPPDFSTLSDGSQRWKALEGLGERPADEATPDDGELGEGDGDRLPGG